MMTEKNSTPQEARVFMLGTNGLDSMLTNEGIVDLSSEEGKVAVVENSNVEMRVVPVSQNEPESQPENNDLASKSSTPILGS